MGKTLGCIESGVMFVYV